MQLSLVLVFQEALGSVQGLSLHQQRIAGHAILDVLELLAVVLETLHGCHPMCPEPVSDGVTAARPGKAALEGPHLERHPGLAEGSDAFPLLLLVPSPFFFPPPL